MSIPDGFLGELAEAIAKAGLQVIFIGNSAALLHSIPVSTQDVDLLVRDHPLLQKKLEKFAADFGVVLTRPKEKILIYGKQLHPFSLRFFNIVSLRILDARCH